MLKKGGAIDFSLFVVLNCEVRRRLCKLGLSRCKSRPSWSQTQTLKLLLYGKKLRLQRGDGMSESIVELPKTRICLMMCFFRCSFLVCSMYQEAASLASSILERLRHGSLATLDMLESTAMVLLQALIHLPRFFLTFPSPSSPHFILKLNRRCFGAGLNTLLINLDCISFQSKLFLPVFFLLGRYACFL